MLFNMKQRIAINFNAYWYPLLSLVQRDFKVRYSSTVFDIGWVIIKPLIFISLYTLVFSIILKVKVGPNDGHGDFVLFLLSGYFPFMASAEGIQRGSRSLIDNRGLLKKVIFPAEVLPVVGVVSATVTEFIGMGLLLGFAVASGAPLSGWLLLLPLVILLQVIMTVGLAWLLSVLTVFLTDLGEALGLMITGWLFLTPIFYPVDSIPPDLLLFFKLNPMFHFVAAYRAIILQAHAPWPELPVAGLFAFGLSLIGFWFFRKTIDRAKNFI